jgi:predicted alpha/beta hydrolase family esterase
MSKEKVIIIHGTEGNPQENWFPWLADQVRLLGHRAIVPSFPTPENQNVKTWQAAFDKQAGPLDRHTILVGHSLGAGFILRMVEEAKEPVLGTFLVSGFIGALGLADFDPLNAPFFERPFNWERIRTNAGIIRVYNGDNDPYVPLEKGQELAHNLGVELTVINNGGHINASAGFVKFERILDDLIKLCDWS